MLSLAVCVNWGHLRKESVSGIENSREDILDDRLCSIQGSDMLSLGLPILRF